LAKQLTEKAVERLRIKSTPYVAWDANQIGLGIKLTPAGRRIWVAQLRYPGHEVQTTRTLGQFPGMGLAEAREKARRWYDLVKNGIDPEHAEAEERERTAAAARAAALRSAHTFVSVAERYITDRRTNRRAKADAAEIRRMLIAEWGERPIHSITPRDVRELITKLRARVPYDARNAWTHTVGIFKQSVHDELIEASPCASLDKKLLFKGAKIGPRQRVLDEYEIAALWRAAARLRYPYGPLYRLLLLTGCRLNEVAHARWSELHPELRRAIREARGSGVDWSAVPNNVKTWTIPRERFKSDAEHVVPLVDDACTILGALPRFTGCDFLFTTTGTIPINGLSKTKEQLDARMLRTLQAMARLRGDDPSQVNLAPWKNHDLRRVVRTNLSAIGTADHVAEACLGHGRRGISRVYDQHRYLREIRDAMECWAARLREIVSPAPPTPTAPVADVVSLRQGARR
jgi:integrase